MDLISMIMFYIQDLMAIFIIGLSYMHLYVEFRCLVGEVLGVEVGMGWFEVGFYIGVRCLLLFREVIAYLRSFLIPFIWRVGISTSKPQTQTGHQATTTPQPQ